MAASAQPRTDIDLEHYRRLLEEERTRLRTEIERLHAQERAGGPAGEAGDLSHVDQHDADQGTELFLREQDQAIEFGLDGELKQVEAASRKMEAGTYGLCDRCGASIPAERLEILPFAVYCMQCADHLEAQV